MGRNRSGIPFSGFSVAYFSGDWDVHWGYDLDFDPWPFGSSERATCNQNRFRWEG